MLMKKTNNFLMIVALLLFSATTFAQSVTTAGITGKVSDVNDEALVGATVIVVEESTGTQYGTITDVKGYYHIPNMNIGGPYKITFSYIGFLPFEKDNIYLTLGQTLRINTTLSETALELEGVEIIALRNDIFDGNRTGAETVVSTDEIQEMPTLNRSLSDYVRLTPQSSITGGGGISIAGMNNRYNTISIDGAVNNDVFGLAASGTNGGQTGATAISMDAIDEFQIVLAPYDVRQGGFAGASINAVTRRGTNNFDGSAYFLYRNQNFAGKTPGKIELDERTKLEDFTAKTYGLRVGGPIIKNKLFFFLSAEFQRDETPQPYNLSEYKGDSDLEGLNSLTNKIKSYGYDPGSFLDKTVKLESDKLLARLDWNISKHHKLMLRHSYVKSTATEPYRSSTTSIYFSNYGEYFPSITNSFAAELKSNWNKFSNSLIVGYTTVRDDRDPLGDKFPTVRVYDGQGTIYFGSEPYSTGNQLDQDILTINENFTLYKGAHTITFGATGELSKTYNLFMRKAFGEYRYGSIEDFLNNETVSAIQYERGYSLVDNIVGDGSAAAADFRTLKVGFHVQDEWLITDNFKVTAGIRFEIPYYLDQPNAHGHEAIWEGFNDTTIAKIEAYGYDMQGAEAGKMPRSQLMINPRLGFNWDVNGDQTFQVRGGIGTFTSRLPLVWPGGAYTNNGVTIGGVYYKSSWGLPINFRPQWDNQYTAQDFGQTDPIPSGQMDLFAKDFKYPQILRTSIAIDKKLTWGLIGTVEAIYTKTINNVLYYNVNETPSEGTYLTGTPDHRPLYPGSKIESDYTRIILGTNTNKGYAYNFTFQLSKQETKGFSGTIAYTFGRSMAVNDGTSSQNSSQWRYMENVKGLNHLSLTYSDFDLGSRVLAFLAYRKEYANHFATSVSLYFNGQSGQRYSYVYNDYGDLNGEGENPGNLIYIPEYRSDIILVDIGVPGDDDYVSAEQQWSNLNTFIESDKYLKEHRGDYAERNGTRLPFEGTIDLRVAQDFYMNVGKNVHTLQISFDIFNFANLLNNDWGTKRYISNNAYQLIKFKGFEDDGTTPKFNYTGPTDVDDVYSIDDSGVFSSRWQAQIGIRYIFGKH